MDKSVKSNELLYEALALMGTALDLLDQDGSVGSVGAQLDLARSRLSDHLERSERFGIN